MDLVQRFGSIENIYEHLEDIGGEVAEKLRNGIEDALFSKQLIELIQIPELTGHDLEHTKVEIDFEKWKKILILKRGFNGFHKFFIEREKKYHGPQQLGLF